MERLDSLPEAHRRIAEVIGYEAMMKLCEVYGGANLYVPGLSAVSAARRNQEILYLHGIGIKAKDIAQRFHITSRAVTRIIATSEGIADGQEGSNST